jgi:hypothetical protein
VSAQCSLPSHRLVANFIKEASDAFRLQKSGSNITTIKEIGPVELLEELENSLKWDDAFAPAVARALAFCLMTRIEDGPVLERPDRLPLKGARMEFELRRDARPFEFMKHVLESWIFAQHVYWSIGRGLADARARGKTILRLKVVLEDGGWALAPGVARGSFPVPTADRFGTVLSLVHECGLIEEVAS